MLYDTTRYRYEAAAGAGGGSGTRASSSGGSAEVKINVEVYDTIVDYIEECKDEIISTESGYVEPDEVCLRNDVIPDYQQADHEVEDMLRLMKRETEEVIKTMRIMRDDYIEVDEVKSAEHTYG